MFFIESGIFPLFWYVTLLADGIIWANFGILGTPLLLKISIT
jgi:hypothetical protein